MVSHLSASAPPSSPPHPGPGRRDFIRHRQGGPVCVRTGEGEGEEVVVSVPLNTKRPEQLPLKSEEVGPSRPEHRTTAAVLLARM